MLISRYNSKGVTLVELVVAMAILVILFAAAAPSFSEWIQNSRIRKAADSIQNGLALARSAAVHRNATAQFIVCDDNDGTWDLVVASATASTIVCGTTDAAPGWQRVQQSGPSQGTEVDASQSSIGFNSMGRQSVTTDLVNGGTTASPPVAVDINVTSSANGQCFCPAGNCGYPAGIGYANTGKLRCLRISVSSGGQVRMCDPALAPGSPQGC